MLRCGAGPVLRSTYVGVFPLRCTTSASLRCVRPCTTPTRASGDALAAGSINGAGEAHMSDVILETRNLTKEFKGLDRKSTRLNSSHLVISYAVFCLNKHTS